MARVLAVVHCITVANDIRREEAWRWPVIIEGSMSREPAALPPLACYPPDDEATGTPRSPAHKDGTAPTKVATVGGGGRTDVTADCADEHLDVRTPVASIMHTPRILARLGAHTTGTLRAHTQILPGTVRTLSEAGERTPENLALLTQQACARGRAGRRHPDLVAQVLVLHHVRGLNPSQIGCPAPPRRVGSSVVRLLHSPGLRTETGLLFR